MGPSPKAEAGRPAQSDLARRILERSGIQPSATRAPAAPAPRAFARAESEDDDGYDPYSDRPAPREEPFQADPWD